MLSNNPLRQFTRYLPIFILVAIFILNMPKVNAQAQVACQQRENTYLNVQTIFPNVDISRTTMNIVTTAGQEVPVSAVFGANIDQICGCARYIHEELGHDAVDLEPGSVDTYNPATCSQIVSAFMPPVIQTSQQPAGNVYKVDPKSSVNSSLVGVLSYVSKAAHVDNIPVNLAFYFQDSVAHVPFVGKALAQSVTYGDPFVNYSLSMVLGAWKLFRNIAYGLLSVVMLVLGFMIMNRRRIDQQAVVTAQYAIPRVIIALFLITFSYPIGATMIAIARSLMVSIVPLLNDAAVNGSGLTTMYPAQQLYESGGIFPIIWFVITGAGLGILTGGLTIIIPALIIVVVIIGLLWVAFKMGFIMIKMLLSIVTAPIIFVFGAIPGNDNMVIDWFKQMVSWMLSIPAMAAIIGLSGLLVMNMYITAVDAGFGTGVPLLSGLLAVGSASFLSMMGMPIFLLIGLYFANQAPTKVDALIMGEKKGGKR